jgi:hypothetical protein
MANGVIAQWHHHQKLSEAWIFIWLRVQLHKTPKELFFNRF